MPKISKRDEQQPLQEVATAMEGMEGGTEGQEPPSLPGKPGFAPLSGGDAETKVEFRRVSCLVLRHALLSPKACLCVCVCVCV